MLDARLSQIVATSPLPDQDRFVVWARYCQIHQDPARRDLAVRLAAALGLDDRGPGLVPTGASA
jgi:hypothetical protein